MQGVEFLPTIEAAGFNKRKAQRYLQVAGHPFLTISDNMSFLPEDLTKQYLLSQFDVPTLEAAHAADRLSPQMTLRDIEALVMPDVKPHAKVKAVELGDLGGVVYKSDLATIIHGDCRKVVPRLPDESVHLALFDFPYVNEFSYLWPAMAEQMARVLIPGGSVIALCGHLQVEFVLTTMREHLRNWWFCGMGHRANLNPLPGARVAVAHKPAVWFVKEFYRGEQSDLVPADFVTPKRRDKEHHHWGQPIEWFEHWIEHLTGAGETVLDPTCGAGPALVAASQLGRRSVGVDISRHHCGAAERHSRELEPDGP